ncbi:MAG: SH3 domain-containing protein [Nitrosospira sp.]|nr:SH3 domain-containing protein [Nitrosospira sp.]
MPGWIILLFLGLSIMGCAVSPTLHSPGAETLTSLLEPLVRKPYEMEHKQLLAEKEAQQREIERLQKLLAEKEAQIRSQQVQQHEKAKQLQETTSQAAHAQVKLRRLATRPAAASAIAEVEMVMEDLKSSSIAEGEQVLQTQAQRLLNAATALYAEENYASAVDHAAQAREFVDMVTGNRGRKNPDQVTIALQVPIPVQAANNINLRQKPGLRAPVLTILQKDSLMTVEAYRGDWLQVITAEGRTGWVSNTLVEAQLGKPRSAEEF